MGKSRNRRHKPAKPNPTGLPTVKDMELEEAECPPADEGSMPSTIQSVLEKLQSPTVEEQECACWTISALATQDDAIKHLLRHNLVKIVAPLMTSTSAVVRHSSVSALRNLSNHGNEVCDALVKDDVMTMLVTLIKTYSEIWQPSDERDRVDSKREIFIEATHLLWNLCESNEQAVMIFNREDLLGILSKCLVLETYGKKVVMTVAQCLHAVTEDNPDTQLNLLDSTFYEHLTKLLVLEEDNADARLIRVLAAGIILNLHGGKLASCTSVNVIRIVKVLSEVLLVDTVSQLNALSAPAARKGMSEGAARNGNNKDISEQLQQELDCSLTAQQVALEVLTNLCFNDDGNSEWADTSSSGESEDIYLSDDGRMDGDVAFCKDFIPSDVHEAIVNLDLIQMVLSKLTSPATDITNLKKLPYGAKIVKKLMVTQCRALCCLQNLVTCLDIQDFGGAQEMYGLWTKIGQHILGIDEEHTQLLESATGAMRAILEKLAGCKSARIEQISPSDLDLLCGVYQRCTDSSVQVNVIRIAGTLGTAVWTSDHTDKIALIKTVALFLLEVLSGGRELWVEAEALDAIFDVFADDDLDTLAVNIELLEKLKRILPQLKQKISANKKTLGDNYPVVITARDNLVRFIKYKTKYHQNHK